MLLWNKGLSIDLSNSRIVSAATFRENIITIIAIFWGIISSLFVHELGHIFIAICYNLPVVEVGIRADLCKPFLYTKVIGLSECAKREQIAFYSGGINTHFLLCAVFSMISDVTGSFPMLIIALANIFFAICNLLPIIPGTDGNKIMSVIFGSSGVCVG